MLKYACKALSFERVKTKHIDIKAVSDKKRKEKQSPFPRAKKKQKRRKNKYSIKSKISELYPVDDISQHVNSTVYRPNAKRKRDG